MSKNPTYIPSNVSIAILPSCRTVPHDDITPVDAPLTLHNIFWQVLESIHLNMFLYPRSIIADTRRGIVDSQPQRSGNDHFQETIGYIVTFLSSLRVMGKIRLVVSAGSRWKRQDPGNLT